MATCRICGAVKPNLPDNWDNWQCPNCLGDELDGVVGVHSRAERAYKTTKGHASAPSKEPQIPRKWTKDWIDAELDIEEEDDFD